MLRHVLTDTSRRCVLTGTGGAVLPVGTVVTGADVHDIVADNGDIRLTTELTAPDDGQRGACHLRRYIDGALVRAHSAQYGDRTYFVHSIENSPDSVTVITSTKDVIVLEMEWTTHTLGAGAPLIDGGTGSPRAYGYGYVEGSSVIKRMPSTTLYKRVRIERGAEGYFVGYRTSPHVGPHKRDLPSVYYSNDNTWGERELSPDGGDGAVTFASSGNVARHPAWGAGAAWTAPVVAAVGGNRVHWLGIDDPTYAPWTDAAVIATQHDGFPNEQTSGALWVASIHYDPAVPLVRYGVPFIRCEVGAWQESAIAYGSIVSHWTNEVEGSEYQWFFGATHYVADSSNGFANEPSSGLIALMNSKASALEWPTA